jgi:hypothetical protein
MFTAATLCPHQLHLKTNAAEPSAKTLHSRTPSSHRGRGVGGGEPWCLMDFGSLFGEGWKIVCHSRERLNAIWLKQTRSSHPSPSHPIYHPAPRVSLKTKYLCSLIIVLKRIWRHLETGKGLSSELAGISPLNIRLHWAKFLDELPDTPHANIQMLDVRQSITYGHNVLYNTRDDLGRCHNFMYIHMVSVFKGGLQHEFFLCWKGSSGELYEDVCHTRKWVNTEWLQQNQWFVCSKHSLHTVASYGKIHPKIKPRNVLPIKSTSFSPITKCSVSKYA